MHMKKPATWGGCAQPRRLEWDPLMICAPPALRYSLLAAMQVGGFGRWWVGFFFGERFPWKIRGVVGKNGENGNDAPHLLLLFLGCFFLKLGSIMFNDHWVGICWELVATIFTADVGFVVFFSLYMFRSLR